MFCTKNNVLYLMNIVNRNLQTGSDAEEPLDTLLFSCRERGHQILYGLIGGPVFGLIFGLSYDPTTAALPHHSY